MSNLRDQVIKLAYEKPEYRKYLIPVLRKTAKNPLDEFLEQDKEGLEDPEASPYQEMVEQGELPKKGE